MSILFTNELLAKISEDLIPTLIQYREAYLRDTEQKIKEDKYKKIPEGYEVNLLEGVNDFIDDLIKHEDRFNKVTFEIDGIRYWEDIIRAKIEMVGAIGGFELLQKVYYYLDKHPKNSEHHLSGTFNAKADGIAGWMI